MPIRANALAVMAKAPIAGLVKTRLAPPFTLEQAAEFYRALLIDQLEHLTALRIADLNVAFTPGEALALIESVMPARYQCFPQHGDDLGERMNCVFAELARRGHRNVVLIGSDLPPVPLETLHDAFAQLSADHHRVVLGPSRDGGYYLVGMNQPVPQIFSGMTWSHERVLARTSEKLSHLGVDFRLLPEWFDIDSVEDIVRLQAIPDPVVRAAMKRSVVCLERVAVFAGSDRPMR